MTAQDPRTVPAPKTSVFVPVWLRRQKLEGQAKDLTGAVKS